MSNNENNVNDDIERRLDDIQETDVKQFLTEVVEDERKNLHLQEPQYKGDYREYAEEHIETDIEPTTEEQ